MRITEMIKQKRFAPGKGVTGPPPEKGAGRFIFLLTTHFGRLVGLNLLFVLFCLPVLTIPAAFCGMNRVLVGLVREGTCYLWSDFIGEFRESFLKSLPFGLVFAVSLYSSVYAYGIYTYNAGLAGSVLFAALSLFLAGTTVLFFSYAFVFIPMLPLKGLHIAKNSLIFMLSEWKTNLVIILCAIPSFIVIGTAAATLIISVSNSVLVFDFSIVSILLLVFIHFSFVQLIVCTAVYQPVLKRIVKPYEHSQKVGL